MNQTEWLTSQDPSKMLEFLSPSPDEGHINKASDRKLRLFACACARIFYQKIMDNPREVDFLPAIERAEMAADLNQSPNPSGEWIISERSAAFAARMTIQDLEVQPADLGKVADLLREIMGNPFSPQWSWPPLLLHGSGNHWGAISMAQLAYECRLGDSTLDVARLAVLSDCLEESGWGTPAILAHLRGLDLCPQCRGQPPEVSDSDRTLGITTWLCGTCMGKGWVPCPCPHVRGCWALDQILGKD